MGTLRWTAIALALGSSVPSLAAEPTYGAGPRVSPRLSPGLTPTLREDHHPPDTETPAGETTVSVVQSLVEENRPVDDPAPAQLAQFQIPTAPAEGKPAEARLPKVLTYEYGIGSESEVTYRDNPDLDDRVRDELAIAKPELNGYVTYRPTDWLETGLELIAEWEIPVQEEDRVVLPDGEIQTAETRGLSLQVDQAYVTFKRFIRPLSLTVGRRNFEDDRHWLYDSSLDVVLASLSGKFRAHASVGREALVDLDSLNNQKTDRIDTWILYGEYRGVENYKFAGYAIRRDDRDNLEGDPLLIGLRSLGNPTENFSYWAEFALLRGSDESHKDFSSARAFDVGTTYRFPNLPFNPNITVGFAFATGDRDPDDNENNEFRQTGLQSNETKFAGVSEFAIYGETLDPELSNLEIFTLGLGFRPSHNVSIDFVYHRYRLDRIAEELRNSSITALMNQDGSRPSKDVGDAFDIVVGFRNLFGVRRLGADLRGGWFFPGEAFRNENAGGDFRRADAGMAMVLKLWW